MTPRRKRWRERLAAILNVVGPGLFLIGYNIGTGSVTTMAQSGARFGMALFWALVLSCAFTWVLMVAYGRVTLVTGRTALANIRTHFRWGGAIALYILVALVVGELLALMGIMGVVAELLAAGTRLLGGSGGVDASWIAVVLTAGIILALWWGRYAVFEKILTAFVLLMGVCFAVVLVLVKPDLGAIAAGLVPQVPAGPGAAGLIAATAGTTCSAAVFVMRSIVVAEKGWTRSDLGRESRDALVSAGMMLLLSGIIMAVAAGTLHVLGLDVKNTVDLIQLFEPLGGRTAALILILGVTGAGLSTAFPIALIAPWLVCDFTGRPRNLRSPLFRALGLGGALFCLGGLVIDQPPPALLIFALALQACILPAVVIPIMVLAGRREVMGEDAFGPGLRLSLWAVLLFALATTGFALADFYQALFGRPGG